MSYNFLQWLLESWIALARYHIIVSRFKIRKEKLNDSKKGEFIPESHHANHSLGNHQLWKWNRVIINTVRQMANLLQFCRIENWVIFFVFVFVYLCICVFVFVPWSIQFGGWPICCIGAGQKTGSCSLTREWKAFKVPT